MSARIISGKEIAAQIREELKKEVAELKDRKGVVPGLVTILAGHNPASVSYVTGKQKIAHELGFHSIQDDQPEDISEADLLKLIDRYNNDEKIHGILVQLPLPRHIDEKKVLNAIDPDKDVDGFHPVNVGRLMIGGDEVKFPPCTPAGIQELIIRAGVETSGAEVVVVGRSNIVGKPIANIMLQKGKGANSTVTVVHTGTKNLEAHCKRADILIVAAGVPGLVKPEWIKPGACVIDVGVNRVGEKKSEKTGRMIPILKGDVDFDAAREIAGAITPVPGGVGPMTITMLMKNTVASAKMRAGN
ncbi:MAG TPA: bifunctional methylenetetrahydrofolate dehydrogenase/methenyltetrahydrofolate cyclohydrolase FolD [Nitrospirae bacterium]|nr:bifunctional protein FolD protein [bacterium BMS3Abin10]GBE39068.1 bifunctional protein FolD protein [bacterium BMS3Bbin08]HDH50370.1 bifunctional methylenetetrahydrofolate dehydrogenase/methenyltetrahydrofolate cyclohydrolase FolD [Nitrospirota bacterium]HDK17719.1 bifunctional methylenetetrahydrofolate dehydrogenase/methenyltetrahydrofolate cyclohydrolase FolD [Nitrospirota bacterium]HDK81674.1 bifunctional methylenetetrahydrofolate dehydrogenase/methenyltetrahydrofolate cyclohydrolase Fol